jgi:nitrite reductase/ring-hydroxylating ferredoxin subunit
MDEELDRRGFIDRGLRVAVLSVLAGSCTSIAGLDRTTLDADMLVALSDYPALGSLGGVARINGASLPLALVHLGDGDYRAFSLVCPHAGTTVNWKGSEFVCPNHGARFASDGHWTGGQPTSGLREFNATYDAAAGTVLISSGP